MLNQSTFAGLQATSAMLPGFPNNTGLVRTLLPGHPNVSLGLEVRSSKLLFYVRTQSRHEESRTHMEPVHCAHWHLMSFR